MKNINQNYIPKPKLVRDAAYYANGIKEKNITILSEAITIIESTNVQKSLLAREILTHLSSQTPNACIRLGITGPPGVGKSTWIDALYDHFDETQCTAAVLTIDPSSKSSKGSILGDKTRMEAIGKRRNVFIRPSPSGDMLGGISRKTKETMQLCEYAGFDYICIETVGVGQSETDVSDVVDINILVLQPGAGDDIQGIKRGIMETADILVVNKSDGNLLVLAEQTERQLKSAVSVISHPLPEWHIPIIRTSALENSGFTAVWKTIEDYMQMARASDHFRNKRMHQNVRWFEVQTRYALQNLLLQDRAVEKSYNTLIQEIRSHGLNPILAQDRFIDIVVKNLKKKR